MSDNRGSSGSGVLLAFLAGAVAGAAVALLTTTKTGREMRASVKDWAKGGRGRGVVERAARSVRDAFDDATER
jgi:gas vesicle protein